MITSADQMAAMHKANLESMQAFAAKSMAGLEKLAELQMAAAKSTFEDASEQMKIKIDQRVLTDMLPGIGASNKGATAGQQSAAFNLGTTGSPLTVTKDGASATTSVVDLIVDMGTVLDEANVPESDRFLIIPARMAGLIKKSELKDASLTGDSVTPVRSR